MTSHATPTRLSPELLDRLRAIVGPSHALTDPDQQLPYLRELRGMFEGRLDRRGVEDPQPGA